MKERVKAAQLMNKARMNFGLASHSLSSLFCEKVFDAKAQEIYLPEKIAHHLKELRERKVRFDASFAETIAESLKNWACQFGATHYTHWFQPLTHLSAEKHDSFLSWGPQGQAVDRLKAADLLFSETDASSFPSGGLRLTHEARGYTAWDPASFPFLWESGEGVTLCIPSIFYSWKGVALDHKIPFLRSDQKMQSAVMRLLSLCKIEAGSVYSTLGIEQEYFLIDRSLFNLRPDLMLAGRTVYGAKPSKGQELEDHYFGAVKDKVMMFMREFEQTALRLGIPVKTRHNEVAPAQYESALLFERASIALDHNLLLMEVMRQSAEKCALACLFHEKPFAGLNGSGKHNNWSLATDTGVNLLDPKENSLVFLCLLAAILRGVHEHAGLLRASIASAGNDHRLGGSEAPPSILSVFLGGHLEKLIQDIIQEKPTQSSSARQIDLGLSHLPSQLTDLTDRNRTSFFAFTGNKFEFRAVGASSVCSFPITVLNCIVADSLNLLVDEMEDALKDDRSESVEKMLEKVLPVLRKTFQSALPVLFEGNNYSELWHEEAALRKLPHLSTSVQAFESLRDKKSIRVLQDVLSEEEIESRFHILIEQYAKVMNIETNLMLDMFYTQILPASQKDLGRQMDYLLSAESLNIAAQAQKKLTQQVSALLEEAICTAEELALLQKQSLELGWEAKAKVFSELVAPKIKDLRKIVDALELQIEDELWPFPKYRELLFLRQ